MHKSKNLDPPHTQNVSDILERTRHPIPEYERNCHANGRNRVRYTIETKFYCRISMKHQLTVDNNLELEQMLVGIALTAFSTDLPLVIIY